MERRARSATPTAGSKSKIYNKNYFTFNQHNGPTTNPPRAAPPDANPPRAASPNANPPRAAPPNANPPRAAPPSVTPPRAASPNVTPHRVASPDANPPRAATPNATPPRAPSPNANLLRAAFSNATPPRAASPHIDPDTSPGNTHQSQRYWSLSVSSSWCSWLLGLVVALAVLAYALLVAGNRPAILPASPTEAQSSPLLNLSFALNHFSSYNLSASLNLSALLTDPIFAKFRDFDALYQIPEPLHEARRRLVILQAQAIDLSSESKHEDETHLANQLVIAGTRIDVAMENWKLAARKSFELSHEWPSRLSYLRQAVEPALATWHNAITTGSFQVDVHLVSHVVSTLTEYVRPLLGLLRDVSDANTLVLSDFQSLNETIHPLTNIARAMHDAGIESLIRELTTLSYPSAKLPASAHHADYQRIDTARSIGVGLACVKDSTDKFASDVATLVGFFHDASNWINSSFGGLGKEDNPAGPTAAAQVQTLFQLLHSLIAKMNQVGQASSWAQNRSG